MAKTQPMYQTQTICNPVARHRLTDNPADCTFGDLREVQGDEKKGQQAEAH